MTNSVGLEAAIAEFAACDPELRIGYRETILVFGAACIGPLTQLAEATPDLSASVSSWLGVLASRDPATRAAVVRALARLARGGDPRIAQLELERLGGAPRNVTANAPRAKSPAGRNREAEIHATIIQAAREQRVLTYGDLKTSRGHVGKYLFNISRAEAEQGHPPLTALVVSKTNGLPGDGFLPAMLEIGFAKPGEKVEPVWKRAVGQVHAFWMEGTRTAPSR